MPNTVLSPAPDPAHPAHRARTALFALGLTLCCGPSTPHPGMGANAMVQGSSSVDAGAGLAHGADAAGERTVIPAPESAPTAAAITGPNCASGSTTGSAGTMAATATMAAAGGRDTAGGPNSAIDGGGFAVERDGAIPVDARGSGGAGRPAMDGGTADVPGDLGDSGKTSSPVTSGGWAAGSTDGPTAGPTGGTTGAPPGGSTGGASSPPIPSGLGGSGAGAGGNHLADGGLTLSDGPLNNADREAVGGSGGGVSGALPGDGPPGSEDMVPIPHPAPGELAIVELLINPTSTDTGREWIEIVNRASHAVSLTDLHVADTANDAAVDFTGNLPTRVAVATQLAPGERAVLIQSGDPTKNGGIALGANAPGGAFGTLVSLNNDADTISICVGACATGVLIDRVSWDASLGTGYEGHALVIDEAARRCPATLPFGDAGSFGTPFLANPSCP